jgi:hypothetical protein
MGHFDMFQLKESGFWPKANNSTKSIAAFAESLLRKRLQDLTNPPRDRSFINGQRILYLHFNIELTSLGQSSNIGITVGLGFLFGRLIWRTAGVFSLA